jgi:membrane-associated phospholipid phosphatase
VALALLGLPCRAQAQAAERPRSAVSPALAWPLDLSIVATGTAFLVGGQQLKVDSKVVPPEGLDRGNVHWSFDRSIIGRNNVRADQESDSYRNAAVAYPVVLAFVNASSGDRLGGTLRRSLLYAEAIAVSEGIAKLMKGVTDRPRPFTYLRTDQRPDDAAYNVAMDEAFRSMPSGHATISFCAAGFAMTDQLLSRPQSSWQERVGVAGLGGFLAGMTAGLRVEGGQHFPSDVIVGGLIGTASGVSVPLLHHYVSREGKRTPMPSARAWWQAIAGEVVGIGAGVLVAETY